MLVVIMGVSGSGKSTIGKLLARRLDIPFLDADDFHSKENRQKMQAGQPLNDQDRAPWLQILSEELHKMAGRGAVLACSALKLAYRKVLDPKGEITFVLLHGDPQLIYRRLKERSDHFMPESLLASQIDTLEMPEDALQISIDQSPEKMVEELLNKLPKNGL